MGNSAFCKEHNGVHKTVGDEEPPQWSSDTEIAKGLSETPVPMWKREAEEEQRRIEAEALAKAQAKAKADEAAATLAKQQKEEKPSAPVHNVNSAVSKAKAKAAPQAEQSSSKVATKKRRPESSSKKKKEEAPSKEDDKKKAAPAEEAAPAENGAKTNGKAGTPSKKERQQKWKQADTKDKQAMVEKFHAAAKSGNATAVEGLLQDTDWLSPDAADKDGFTALHIAAQNGQLEMCKVLVKKYSADPLLTVKLGEWGNTPLHYAARGNHLETVKFLVKKGKGALTLKNNQGKVPVEMAPWGDVHDYLDEIE